MFRQARRSARRATRGGKAGGCLVEERFHLALRVASVKTKVYSTDQDDVHLPDLADGRQAEPSYRLKQVFRYSNLI